jgi:hyperosmotically inducible periplasmic protein
MKLKKNGQPSVIQSRNYFPSIAKSFSKIPAKPTNNRIIAMCRYYSSLFYQIIMGLTLAINLTSCAATGTNASTGQYIDDSAISAKIKAKFLNDPVVSGLSISVETHKGMVQLSGFAKTNSEIKQAERLVRETEGVQAVRNDILLKD